MAKLISWIHRTKSVEKTKWVWHTTLQVGMGVVIHTNNSKLVLRKNQTCVITSNFNHLASMKTITTPIQTWKTPQHLIQPFYFRTMICLVVILMYNLIRMKHGNQIMRINLNTMKWIITRNTITLACSFIMVAYSTNWFSSSVILSLHSTSSCSLVSRSESSLSLLLQPGSAKWTNAMLNGCIVF